MKKQFYIIFAVVLILLCFIYNIIVGNRYVIETDVNGYNGSADKLTVAVEQDKEILKVTEYHIQNEKLYITVKSISPGKAFISISAEDEPDSLFHSPSVYVHAFGIITEENFFGRSTGSWSFSAAIIIFLAVLIIGLLIRIKKEMQRNLYQYNNVRNIGFVIFLIILFVEQLILLGSVNYGIIGSVDMLLNSANFFSVIVLPAAFITFILVIVSNIQLMKNEGRNWKNMLGCILGIMVCVGTVFPRILGEFLQQTTIVDVHNQNGVALYMELFVENAILAATAYLECILIGTIVLSTKAARKIPSFDKDYILILGCQIKKDGTLTNLLKSRADRAVEFAKMQKNAVKKDITFIPSGGKGDDEIIAEADAIKNYLVSIGVPENSILVENKSQNTYENLRNSMELIRNHTKNDDPKIAFSTTNYHVFRSGVFASRQGIRAEGIGAKTKRYFWINAFIREFIAALVSEWKTHIAIIMTWIVIIILMVGIVYFSNNL